MRTAAVILIVAALGLAGLTFFLVQTYLDDQIVEVAIFDEPAAVEVVVADRDLPAGSVIEPSRVRWQAWPDDSVDDAYVVQRSGVGEGQIDDLVGSVVRRAIAAGEPITASKVFKRENAGFLAGMLRPGMRAVSITVTAASGAAGFILPNDRVDVVLSSEWREKSEELGAIVRRFSETILYDVRVLAIDQSTDDVEDSAQVSETATLEITQKQAEMVAVATSMGRLSLALRSLTPGPGDSFYGDSFTSDREVSRALGGRFSDAERRAQPAPEPVVVKAPTKKPVVKASTKRIRTKTVQVYRSSEVSTLEFKR